jgi:parallel beta-helix repeat protein
MRGLVIVIVAAALLAPAAQAGLVQDLTPLEYVPRTPIVLEGNEEPVPYVSGVVSGKGLPEDPYIIEGWDIQAMPGGLARGLLPLRDVDVADTPVPLSQVGQVEGMGGLQNVAINALGDLAAVRIANTIFHVVVRNNFLHDIPGGVVIENAPNVVVEDNLVAGVVVGVKVQGDRGAVVRGNTIVQASSAGVFSRDAGIEVVGNTIQAPRGVALLDAFASLVRDNHFPSSLVAIDVQGEGGHLIEGNTIRGGAIGMRLHEAGLSIVQGNSIDDATVGFDVQRTALLLLQDNVITDAAEAIALRDAPGNTIAGNQVARASPAGIVLRGTSDANAVEDNGVSRSGTGIAILGGRDNVVRGNDLSRNAVGVALSVPASVERNTVDLTTDGIVVRGAPEAVLQRNVLNGAQRAILVEDSPGVAIADSTVGGSAAGVVVLRSANATVLHNALVGNGCGMHLADSPGSLVRRNDVFSSTANGIEVVASNATVVEWNNIAGNLPFGLRAVQNGGPLKAERNYWGDILGPWNWGGKGDKVDGDVDAWPYEFQPIAGTGPRPA